MIGKICLITGATGFIGQHIIGELVAKGYKIIGIDRPDNLYCAAVLKDNQVRMALNVALDMKTFEKSDMILRFGDVADQKFMQNLFMEAEKNHIEINYVLHFAACATIQQALKEAEKTWQTNYHGTVNTLDCAVNYQLKHPETFYGFFYASTDKVYGEGSLLTYNETDVLKPLPYPYDESKAKADAWVRKIAKEKNFPAVIYRFCNVYGPGDYHESRIVPGTLHRVLHKKEAPILRMYRSQTGEAQSFYRDMIYVKDLTNAIALLLEHLKQPSLRQKLSGEAFNLGTNNSYPMKEVIDLLMNYSGSTLKTKEEVIEKGEIKKQCMNFEKLNQFFGFKPKYDLKKGLKETVLWYAEHKGEIDDKFI